MDFEQLPPEIAALVTIQRHITTVQKYLNIIIGRVQSRSIEHDLSKLSKAEFVGFVELNHIRQNEVYGTPRYHALIEENRAVELHITKNSHHPEFYPLNGVDDMTILDWIEMVTDWKAGETYGSPIDLEHNKQRFNLSDNHMWLIRLILKELE